MSTNVNKKGDILPCYHVVYCWNTRLRGYRVVGASYVNLPKFSAVFFLSSAPLSFRASLISRCFDLSSAFSMPCSVWVGFSTNELPF